LYSLSRQRLADCGTSREKWCRAVSLWKRAAGSWWSGWRSWPAFIRPFIQS